MSIRNCGSEYPKSKVNLRHELDNNKNAIVFVPIFQ